MSRLDYARFLRARIGLRLIEPWLQANAEAAYGHAKNRDPYHDYSTPDYWWGKYNALHQLYDALKDGAPVGSVSQR